MDNPHFKQQLETASRSLDQAFGCIRSQADLEAFAGLLRRRQHQYGELWVGRIRRQAADGVRYLTPEKLWTHEAGEAEVYFDPNAAQQDASSYAAEVEKFALAGQ